MARLFGFIVVWVMLVMSAVAQTGGSGWPQRAIRLIVPFPAGSSTDIAARIVAQKLGLGLGQQVVIENRPGASGNIGAEVVAKAVPDGYTIGIATASTHAVAASLSTALPYDPVKDFAAIGMIGDQPYVLVVHPALAVHSLSDLIGLAKAKPRALNYGSAGVASLAHLATALFAKMAGMEIIHVPYKSSSQSMVDMITGRLDMQLATVAPSLPNIRAHQLRAVATSGRERVPVLPDVSTIAESGLAGYEAVLWIALVAPAGTAPAIVARLNSELNGVLSSRNAKEALDAQGVQSEPGQPGAVTERIRADTEKWRAVVAQIGIRSE
jgi:tripartite-type tricarboxylate transporter receptor subunit TctC